MCKIPVAYSLSHDISSITLSFKQTDTLSGDIVLLAEAKQHK